jgi:checkpoint serine/threonine-protein kinase
MATRRSVDRLDRERQQFRAKLSTAIHGGDSLDIYDDFVQWTLKNYSSDDPNSGLLELLEESTRNLMADDAYKADQRYLNLWCLYAQEVHQPCDVYKFCAKREIGTMWSRFYEEYALALEMDGL